MVVPRRRREETIRLGHVHPPHHTKTARVNMTGHRSQVPCQLCKPHGRVVAARQPLTVLPGCIAGVGQLPFELFFFFFALSPCPLKSENEGALCVFVLLLACLVLLAYISKCYEDCVHGGWLWNPYDTDQTA